LESPGNGLYISLFGTLPNIFLRIAADRFFCVELEILVRYLDGTFRILAIAGAPGVRVKV
jgi:hypothetical protein